VTGSILRFHEDFIAQYGPLHRLNTKIFHAARKAEVGSTDSIISKTLISWSKQIRQDFNERNIDIHMSRNDNKILLEGLLEEVSKQNQLNKQIVQMNTLVLKKQDDLNSMLLQLEVVFQATIRYLQQSLDAFAKHLNERKRSPTERNSSESISPRLEADYNQQQNESFSGTSSNTQLVVDVELETEQPSIKESKPVLQLQNIVSDIPMDTKNLEIKNLLKYHYESKHFHPSKSGKFTMISPPTFYKSKDKSKHRLLMKFFQIVWENDSEKFSDLFTQNLNAVQLTSVWSSFQQEAMNTLVKLEMSVRIFNSEEEKGKAASNAVQSNRRKPFVIGVANRYAAYCEEKSKLAVENIATKTKVKEMMFSKYR
jgi:hypothetical protein